MNLTDLPPAHLGPFQLEGLNWMVLPDGHTRRAVTGVTSSLAVARAADAKLRELGFSFGRSLAFGPMGRLYQFDYGWIENVRGINTYFRTVEVVLTAVEMSDVPWYEIIDQDDRRLGGLLACHEAEAEFRQIRRPNFLLRPTLDVKP